MILPISILMLHSLDTKAMQLVLDNMTYLYVSLLARNIDIRPNPNSNI